MENNLNTNDYYILQCVIDVEQNRGLVQGRGSTKKQIIEKSGFSSFKVHNTLKVLLQLELISYGVKHEKAKTYCITKKGYEILKKLKESII